jgi:hypothetical protein
MSGVEYVDIDLLPHQLAFINDTTTRYLALCGGYGCGKTFSFIHKGIDLAFRNPGCEGALLEPTIDMARRILVPEMCRILEEMGIKYVYKRADKEFYIDVGDGQVSKIHILSGENYTRLVGLNLAFWGVDEVDTIRDVGVCKDMFDVLISRLRDADAECMQGFFTSTPEGFHFLYNTFVKDIAESITNGKPIKNRKIIKGKTEDNPYVDPDYVAHLMADYTEEQCKAYLNGEFVNLTSGTVYYAFDRTLNHSDVKLSDFDTPPILHCGIDFNVGKCVAIVHVIVEGNPIAVDEITGIKNTQALADELERRYPKNRLYLYPDSSGSSNKTNSDSTDHLILKKVGSVIAPPKNGLITDRVNTMNGMFCNAEGERRYLINTTTCPVYTTCLEQQAYDKHGKPDKSNDLDHPLDGAGYFIVRKYPMKRKTRGLRIGG